MEVIVAKFAGMCGGVKHTVDMANKILDENKQKTIYCLGKLVHNENVIKKLENKGMKIVENINEVPNNSIVIFRAHGVTKDNYEIANEKNLKVYDLTCENVKKIQRKVINNKQKYIIIIGKKDHAESVATKSFADTNSVILENEEEIKMAIQKVIDSKINKVYIVAQTTYSSLKFNEISEKLKERLNSIGIETEIDKTICMATEIRQKEADELSKKADSVIVIGGKNSSNTKKLYDIALNNCKNVYFIESAKELNIDEIKNKNYKKILILAGASTPSEDIKEVKEKLEI